MTGSKPAEWGEWFPARFYGFPYNESWSRYFLAELSEEQIFRRGLTTSAPPLRAESKGSAIPDSIDEFSEDCCAKELVCITGHQRFNVGLQELRALQKQRCPIPRKRWSVILTEMRSLSIQRCNRELEIDFTQLVSRRSVDF